MVLIFQKIVFEILLGFSALFAAAMIMGTLIIPCVMLLHYYEAYTRRNKNKKPPSLIMGRRCKFTTLEKLIFYFHIAGIIVITTIIIVNYVHPWMWR